MKGYLYSIFDSISEEFTAPTFSKNQKVAFRQFQAQKAKIKEKYNDKDLASEVDQFLSLYQLGEFDTDTGKIMTEKILEITEPYGDAEGVKRVEEQFKILEEEKN